ncbi:hypothetical protein JXC34_06575 [Candidatus Woesearchaeota archaeon]|nr:hypothetical protein [Candidatus Woesearchaeota archaeon]
MSEITEIKAKEVLDSRGNPTKPFTKALREKRLRTISQGKKANSPNGEVFLYV